MVDLWCLDSFTSPGLYKPNPATTQNVKKLPFYITKLKFYIL